MKKILIINYLNLIYIKVKLLKFKMKIITKIMKTQNLMGKKFQKF